jgi:DNA-directed RNA polymerase sigma subunit (sigma70/sigma32)
MADKRSHKGRQYFQKEREPSFGAIRTHEEVAAKLGISRQAVQKLERRTLAKLRLCRPLREYSQE